MPVYQYIDTEHHRTIELIRPVAERDLVPAGLKRITVPQRVAIGGTSSSPADPTSCEAQVQRAYRDLEQKMPAREIAKEGGFTVERIKDVWKL